MYGTRVAVAAAALLGMALGLGAFTFVYAKGDSYLTTDPAACANCHVMREHYDAWQKSSHRNVAGCSDCHMPHDFVGKWTEKASNGFLHSLAFTTGRFPDPLQIRPVNRAVTEEQCRHCHATVTEAIEWGAARPSAHERGPDVQRAAGARPQVHDGIIEGDRLACIRCHAYVGHWVR